jgi:hypothetical protein
MNVDLTAQFLSSALIAGEVVLTISFFNNNDGNDNNPGLRSERQRI